MPMFEQILWCLAASFAAMNWMFWLLWHHYRPSGVFGAGPRFTHDCDRCTFLGRYDMGYRKIRPLFARRRDAWRLRRHDLYVCDTRCFGTDDTGYFGTEYVARRGDDGPEYLAGAYDLSHPALAEAERRWRQPAPSEA